jgi:hypothetical protein
VESRSRACSYYRVGVNECKVIINRYQTGFAEQYAQDLKDLLSVVPGWTFEERFASKTVGGEVVIGNKPEPRSKQCAGVLAQSIKVYGTPRTRGGRIAVDLSEELWESHPTDYLTDCKGPCIEFAIGLEKK